MGSDGASTVQKVMEFAGLGLQLVIICLLLWLVYKGYECASDNSTCSPTIYGIIRMSTKYDKYSDTGVVTPVESISDSSVTSANTCAKWCTKTYGCNGFVWNGVGCGQITADPTTLTTIPASGTTLYVNKDIGHPTTGFVTRPAGDDFSNKVEQRLNSPTTGSISLCAQNCVSNVSSNCIGFSYTISSNTCQLVSNIANVVTTTGVQSYTWGTIPSTAYSAASF